VGPEFHPYSKTRGQTGCGFFFFLKEKESKKNLTRCQLWCLS
jgi:hypothetical protein